MTSVAQFEDILISNLNKMNIATPYGFANRKLSHGHYVFDLKSMAQLLGTRFSLFPESDTKYTVLWTEGEGLLERPLTGEVSIESTQTKANSDVHIVFKFVSHDELGLGADVIEYFAYTGYYSSWDGLMWSQGQEVKPVLKNVTDWEEVK